MYGKLQKVQKKLYSYKQ